MTVTTETAHQLSVRSFGTVFEESGIQLTCSCGWKIIAAGPPEAVPPYYEKDGMISLEDLDELAGEHLQGTA